MKEGNFAYDDLCSSYLPMRMITMNHVLFQVGRIASSAVSVNVQKLSR